MKKLIRFVRYVKAHIQLGIALLFPNIDIFEKFLQEAERAGVKHEASLVELRKGIDRAAKLGCPEEKLAPLRKQAEVGEARQQAHRRWCDMMRLRIAWMKYEKAWKDMV